MLRVSLQACAELFLSISSTLPTLHLVSSKNSTIFAATNRYILIMNRNNLVQWIFSLLFGVAIALFGAKAHPELFSWHEQNQMFLFTHSYFMERMAVAGGLADYVSEFLTQFYYYPALGAILLAVIYVALQLMLFAVIKGHKASKDITWTAFVLSFLPVVVLCGVMGDMDMLLSFPVALLFSLCTYLLCRPLGFLAQFIASLPLYWLAGPAFGIQVLLALTDELCREKKWSIKACRAILLLAVAIAWVWICRTFWVAQYPWGTVLAGINYYRISLMTLDAPLGIYIVMLLMALVPTVAIALNNIHTHLKLKSFDTICTCCLTVLLCNCIYESTSDKSYDPNNYAMLRQMFLLRRSDWQGIIDHAREKQSEHNAFIETPLSGNAVNLALGMTQQMSTHMFDLPQRGIRSLIMPNVRDNVSNVASMEVFWQLGFINESMRYAFDSQESIPNCRKSARFTQRMAECNIINGKYDVASKYIDQLKHTLFYSKWAEQAETFLYNEDKIFNYSPWSIRRKYRLTEDFLFYYPEMTKMIGHLVLHNRENRLAFDYFMAALLLEGNYQSFIANLPQQPKPDQDPFPHGYKEYIEYMQNNANSADAVTGASY